MNIVFTLVTSVGLLYFSARMLSAERDASAEPPPSTSAVIDDPKAVVKRFLEAVANGDVEKVEKLMIKQPDEVAVEVDLRRNRVIKLIARAKEGIQPVVISQKVEGNAAVVVINEKPLGAAPDYDPVYLLQIGGVWKLLPGLSSFKRMRILKPEEERSFVKLGNWFEENKSKVGGTK